MHFRADRDVGHRSCWPVSSEERTTMIFRVLLYLFLMLGLAVRERVIRAVR
jgi:hypothetical protein